MRGTTTSRPSEFICERCGCSHNVVIYKEGCKYRAEPGRLVVHPGAKVTFVSLVGPLEKTVEVTVWVPDGLARKSPPLVGPGAPLSVEVGKKLGVFPYSVYVPGDIGPDFAEGGSSPRIIVADA